MSTIKPSVVIDTNVAVVSNGQTPQAGPECQRTCIAELLKVRENRRVLLDDESLILSEYRNNLRLSGQPGAGDAFFKWLYENQANVENCLRVRVTSHGTRGFLEFPDKPGLSGFDLDDRKFVAVALASGLSPPVLNASDTDWWHFRDELDNCGVKVLFLCPELMSC